MLLGIDLGTSSLKAILLDPEDASFVLDKEPLEILQPTPELAEGDPRVWWQALVRVLGRLKRDYPSRFEAIEAVGISTIFPALVPLTADGAPLRNALMYCDLRSVPQVRALAAELGPGRFEQITGNQLTPGTCTLPGICWIRDNEPDVFRNTHIFGQATTFLVHRLTGRFVVDYSQVTLSGMTRAGQEETWDAELLALADLAPERLPDVMGSTTVAGTVSAAAARQCGLRAGIPVVAGAGDAPLATVGGGIVGPHELFCSAGTTDCFIFTGDRAPLNPAFANCRYAIPDYWVSIGTMSTGGASVKWFCEKVLQLTPQAMTEAAVLADVGAGGVVFLPYLQGERTPWWDPEARGVLFGMTLSTGRNELCRAVFEGVACGWRQIVALLEEEYGFRAAEVICVGGGSTNDLWNRIKASALNRPIRVLTMAETASVGAALIGGIGAGVFDSPAAAKAATAPLRQSRVVAPEPEWVERYTDVFDVYDRLYPAVKDLCAAHAARCRQAG